MIPEPDAVEPEPVRVRWGVPVAATVLAAVLLGGVLVLPAGAVVTTVVVVGAVVQIGLAVARGFVMRRDVRPPDPGFRWQRFVVAWSVQASPTWLVGGDGTSSSRWVYVGTGLAFAVVLTAFLEWTEREPRAAEPVPDQASDTRPLPVEGD